MREMPMKFFRKLPTPLEIKNEFPLSQKVIEIKDQRDQEIEDILTGKSNKFLVIIGPCSADNEDAVLEYMNRLRPVADKIQDKVFIVPRVYTNKPRTLGKGYKGMLHQPDPQGEEDLLAGIIAIRRMHTRVVEETGFTCADEMLYPENHRYLSDLLSYTAVGARSTEDQQHRLVASGIGLPVGMKNPTAGDMSVMMNSIEAAQSPSRFLYRGWEVSTEGNPLAHAILRGYVDSYGRSHPNYHYEDLNLLQQAYAQRGLANPAAIIDTNHNNSGKNYLEQIRITKDVLHSIHIYPDLAKLVKGLMIESYLEDGNQKIGEGVYGKSITDPCLGWDKTERLLYDIADLL